MWLLIFFLTPIAEMYLLIKVGGYIGAWSTIGLVMLTAVIGVTLLRIQGLATLTRGLRRLEDGRLPAQEVVEGLLLAVAGALLLTPGFITDTVGFLVLLPGIRRSVATLVLSRVQVAGLGPGREPGMGEWPPGGGRPPGAGRSSRPGTSTPIEGEFQRVDPSPPTDRNTD